MSDTPSGFQPLSDIVGGVIAKIVEQTSAGARGSATSDPSGPDAVAGLGGAARAVRAGTVRFPLPLPNQPLLIPATLHLSIGDWPVIDMRADYVVHHACDGAIKLMGVRVLAKNGSTIDINRGGTVALDADNTLVSYMAKAIWAAADTQFEDVRTLMRAQNASNAQKE